MINANEMEQGVGTSLVFGTGGLRALMGDGPARMNSQTVRLVTQGVADYILGQKNWKKGVVVAYDTRNNSRQFAWDAALCLCANGIPVYIFDSNCSTPELSFAVRHLNCLSGIMITASHNPKEYNGYKLYWENGGQIISPRDKEIAECISNIQKLSQIKTLQTEQSMASGRLHVLGSRLREEYTATVMNYILRKDIVMQSGNKMKIIYTPLHGTGCVPVPKLLNRLGLKGLYTVDCQMEPNGDFPTVPVPNPEIAEVFSDALNLAQRINGDIILATDPDGDRIGVYEKNLLGDGYIRFDGNMLGTLLAEYRLATVKEKGALPDNGLIISTIVSTRMTKKIAEKYGIRYKETFTGFKYIGQEIDKSKEEGLEFLFGLEESFGCLIGPYIRDKDGIGAAAAVCEAAAYYRMKGSSLWQQMIRMYEEYGYYREDQLSFSILEVQGAERMMKRLRRENSALEHLGGFRIIKIRDYEREGKISNVMYYQLEQESWLCIRPSGTEPKVKVYTGVRGDTMEEAKLRSQNLGNAAKELLRRICL